MSKFPKSPLVSIIIPAFNSESYISETLTSVLNQTYQNFEIIVIDDGSTDSTKKVVQKLSSIDNRLKYFYQQNMGQGSARNHGIKLAQGKLIAFLDSDDLWMNTKLEEQIKILNQSDIDLIFCSAECITNENITNHSILSQKGKLFGKDFIHQLFQRSYITNSSILVKSDKILTAGMFSEESILRGTEDWDLLLKLALNNCTFYGLDKYLVRYRVHSSGTHLDQIRMFKGKLHVYEKYSQNKNIPSLLKRRQFRYVCRNLMNLLYENRRDIEIKDILRKLKKNDYWGLATNIQVLLYSFLNHKQFYKISNLFVYKIGYTIEKYHYKLKGML